MVEERKEEGKFISKVLVFVDGASKGNPGPAGIGGIVVDADSGNWLDHFSEFLGTKTNNEAEYMAISKGLSVALGCTRKSVHLFSDSEFAISQIKKMYRIRTNRMEPLCAQVVQKAQLFEHVEFSHLPSENVRIKRADMFANRAINDAIDKPLKM